VRSWNVNPPVERVLIIRRRHGELCRELRCFLHTEGGVADYTCMRASVMTAHLREGASLTGWIVLVRSTRAPRRVGPRQPFDGAASRPCAVNEEH
jgi:hypothetical protein